MSGRDGSRDKFIEVKAIPRSGESSLEMRSDGTCVARLKSSPERGKANRELAGLLARHFEVPRGNIKIVRGESSRKKLIRVTTT